MSILKTIEYELTGPPTYSVICMHGLGASNDDLKPIAQALALPNLRFVFPQAPTRPVTINQGYPMPAWYDVKNMSFASTIYADYADVDAGCNMIKRLIADEQAKHGIGPENIFLMGFSQGGSIALEIGLHAENEFAGIIGLSTLPAKDHHTFDYLSESSRKTPVFLAHGTQDHIVPFVVGEYIRKTLIENHYQVEWHSNDYDHTIWQDEITALRAWLLQLLSKK